MYLPVEGLEAWAGMLAAALGIPALVIVLCILPGWRLSGAWGLPAELRLLASGIISTTFIFLAHWLVYLSGTRHLWAVLAIAVAGLYSLFAFVRRRDTQTPPPAPLIAWFTATLCGVAAQIFVFAPGAPYGTFDWWEHWQRARYYTLGVPLEATIAGFYKLPARGPLFNMLIVPVFEILGDRQLWIYQLVAATLNSWPVVPAFVAFRRMAGMSDRAACAASCLVPWLNTDLSGSIIFPWTKMFSAGIMLSAQLVYFEGFAVRNARQAALGLWGFAVAFLAHYLALPYALMTWGHFALTRHGPGKWKAGAAALLASGAIVTVWFAPFFVKLGVKETLAANTTTGGYYVIEKSGEESSYAKVLAYNVAATLLPGRLLELCGMEEWIPEPHDEYKWNRIYWIEKGQLNQQDLPELTEPGLAPGLLAGFGSCGAILVGLLLVAWAGGKLRVPEHLFAPGRGYWWCFWTIGLLINILPARWYCPGGVVGQNLHLYILWLTIFVLVMLRQLAPRLALLLGAIIAANAASIIATLIQVQSLPLSFQTDGNVGTPILGPFDVAYYYHLKNAARLIESQGVGLYDFCGSARAGVMVILFVAAITSFAWYALGRKPSDQSPQPASAQETSGARRSVKLPGSGTVE